MNRRRLSLLLVGFTSACAIGAACTFPEVTFTGGGTGEGGIDSATADSPAGEDATSGDAAILEAATRDDATAKVPDGACLADDCDCDKDKFFKASCDAGTKSDARVDCDDLDPLRNPAAGLTETAPDEGQVPPGDWNCDGKVDKAYPTGVTCRADLISGCLGGPGFQGDPACGASGDYVECQDKGLGGGGCVPVKLDARKQLCR